MPDVECTCVMCVDKPPILWIVKKRTFEKHIQRYGKAVAERLKKKKKSEHRNEETRQILRQQNGQISGPSGAGGGIERAEDGERDWHDKDFQMDPEPFIPNPAPQQALELDLSSRYCIQTNQHSRLSISST
ncbi:hypothetical protein VKT23_014658 [Stygiomarasmius scandens]|uniref:Uncharacterized protein n=1 Tax=Marasmiellus scandens TaxID=2682957 RepID=A0ABR1J2F1_9AGAR